MAYSIKWSGEIVAKFWKEHQESCLRMEQIFNITPRHCIEWLSNNSVRWAKYKRLIKYDQKVYYLTLGLFEKSDIARKNYCTFDQYYRKHLGRVSLESRGEQLDMFTEEVYL